MMIMGDSVPFDLLHAFALFIVDNSLTVADIVISEVYHPSSIVEGEFIEIHNPGSEPVDLSGWWLRRHRVSISRSDGITAQ